jgi:hypothetical protein
MQTIALLGLFAAGEPPQDRGQQQPPDACLSQTHQFQKTAVSGFRRHQK